MKAFKKIRPLEIQNSHPHAATAPGSAIVARFSKVEGNRKLASQIFSFHRARALKNWGGRCYYANRTGSDPTTTCM
jgi:hypothetical protein